MVEWSPVVAVLMSFWSDWAYLVVEWSTVVAVLMSFWSDWAYLVVEWSTVVAVLMSFGVTGHILSLSGWSFVCKTLL